MLVGAVAAVVPMTAMVTFVGRTTERLVELTAAAPPGATESPTTSVAEPVPGARSETPSSEPGPVLTTPTTEAQLRVIAGPARTEPETPPTSVATYDDPVVRPAPVTTVPASGGGSSSSGPLPSVVTTIPPLTRQPPPCPASEVRVTVATERPTYAPGEVVRATSTLENRSATTCLLPTRAFFRIENSAGTSVGSFAYTMDFRLPVQAEPGKTFTSTMSWDQRDCSGSTCAQVPAGSYTVVADWTESGPYSARIGFQIGS